MSTPIYFLPGMLCDDRLWRPVWTLLKQVVPQEAWHGRFCLFDDAANETIADFAQTVVALAAGKPGIVAGFSLGGHVAFELYRQAPELVAGLVLCNTSAGLDTPERRREREAFLSTSETLGRFKGVTKSDWSRYVSPQNANNKAMLSLVQSMTGEVGISGAKRQARALLNRQESLTTLAAMAANRLPLCMCAGVDDQITPMAQTEQMAKAADLPVSSIVRLSSGHMGPLEAPQAVAMTMAKLLASSAT